MTRRLVRRALALSLLAAALACAGCPGAAEKKTPLEPCTRVGQSCELSPGKLGTCILRDDCSGSGCFVCQSQH
jgi:hypothetical protein